MFIVLLRFSEQKSLAPQYMDAHNQWFANGIKSGVFALVGGLEPKQGGVLLARGISFDAITKLVNDDPFVQNDVVSPEILQINPAKFDERLRFLMDAV